MTKKERIQSEMDKVKSEIDELMRGDLTPRGEAELNLRRQELVNLTNSFRQSDMTTLLFRIPKADKEDFKSKVDRKGTTMTKFILEKIRELINE